MSPTSEAKNNCGTIYRKCKTFDDAIKVSLDDHDQSNLIILDGGETEKNMYNVRLRNIVYNKSLLIKGDSNSKFFPVIKNIGVVSQDDFLFVTYGHDINISIQSVQMENIAFINVKRSENLNVTVNNCYAKLSSGFFIKTAQDAKSVKVSLKNSSIIGDLKLENGVALTSLMGKESNLIQLVNCSFEYAAIYIKIFGSSHVSINNCVFINTVMHVARANHLHIAHSTFKNYFRASVKYSSLGIMGSNATVENCSFFNNTNYRIYAKKCTLSMNNIYFFNNSCFESAVFIYSLFSHVTLFKLEIHSTNFYRSLIRTKKCKIKMIGSVVRNTINSGIIYASDTEKHAANEQKTRSGSLIIMNTTISENIVSFIVRGEGAFKILHCSIQKNIFRRKSGYILFSRHQLSISHTVFSFNSVVRLILCHGNLYVVNTLFISNNASRGIVTASIHLKSSRFERNVVTGNLLDIEKSRTRKFSTDSSTIEDLTFVGNIIKNDLINTNFSNQRQDDNIRIDGIKAIHNSFRSCFAIKGGFTTISNSYLAQNKATGFGKLVNFQSSCHTSHKSGLKLRNLFSSFNTSDAETVALYVNMVTEYLSVKNVTLDLLDTNGAIILPVIEFERNHRTLNKLKDIDLDVKIQCPYNYNPNTASHVSNSKFVYELSCKSCARGLYSFNRGFKTLTGVNLTRKMPFNSPRFYIKNVLESEKPFKCHACPAGGICEYGARSRGNFYGYLNNNGMLQFVPCPENYCCSKEGVECSSYNTCNSYRTGTLCGACKQGYFISYFSNKCIPISKCTGATRFLFWVSYIVVSVSFTIVLCFVKDIFVLCRKGLLFLKNKMRRQKHEVENSLIKLRHDRCVSEPNSKQTQTKIPKEISYSAIFNVLVSFYQLRSLLQIPIDDKIDSFYTSAVSDFFNLNIMLQTADKYCPTRDTDAVYRDFLRSFLLPVFMISSILVALYIKNIFRFIRKYVFREINQCGSKSNKKILPLRKRFYVGFYIVVAFSYQKVSTFAFRIIHCVEINSENVLYIAGNTKCYNTWQVLDMLFLAFWIIPFPASVSCGYHLLKKDKINVRVFMLCIILPPATPLIYILIKCFHISIKARNCRHEEHIKSKFSDRFEEPYRKNYFWWETWTLYERLIVGCLTTFLVDPVIRLFALTPALLLFLWIHIRAKPFKYTKSLLYQVDMASYVCLCLSLVINIFRAVVYIYSLPLSQQPINFVLRSSMYLEHLFTPVWILIMRFLVFVVSLIRVKSKKT